MKEQLKVVRCTRHHDGYWIIGLSDDRMILGEDNRPLGAACMVALPHNLTQPEGEPEVAEALARFLVEDGILQPQAKADDMIRAACGEIAGELKDLGIQLQNYYLRDIDFIRRTGISDPANEAVQREGK